jgi:membrane associated rhomboid family serine protease
VIPYRDENETVRTPIVTIALIAANVLVWLVVQGAGSPYAFAASVCNYGLIPAELLHRAPVGSAFPIGDRFSCLIHAAREPERIFTSMFLHGDWMHLIFNMWFLWLFGNNVEDSMGRVRFLLFYLLCGVGAAIAQVVSSADSIYPMVGASGAIGGVMGAYVILYPHVRVYVLVPIFFFLTTLALPAWVMLGYWMFLQLIGSVAGDEGGVAFSAHVGGFLTGAILIKAFARSDYIAEHRAHQWRPSRFGLRRSRF